MGAPISTKNFGQKAVLIGPLYFETFSLRKILSKGGFFRSVLIEQVKNGTLHYGTCLDPPKHYLPSRIFF